MREIACPAELTCAHNNLRRCQGLERDFSFACNIYLAVCNDWDDVAFDM